MEVWHYKIINNYWTALHHPSITIWIFLASFTRTRINWPLPMSLPQPISYLFLKHHPHWPYFKFPNELTFAHQKLCTGYYLCLECFSPPHLVNFLTHKLSLKCHSPLDACPSTTPSRSSITISWIIKQWPPAMCIISAGLSERPKK